MDTPAHVRRRGPVGSPAPLDLQHAADELLSEAAAGRAGRAARTLTPGAGAPLKQTLLALVAGRRLQDHVAPGPTTLLGVRGTAVLEHDGGRTTLTEGTWAPCPTSTHALDAVSDAVVLLTVVPDATDADHGRG